MIRLALALVSLLFIGFNYASGEDELYCLAQNIYFEAGNQPLAGKIAVANVTFNRVEDPQFPDTICGVVYQAKTRVNWKGDVVPIKHKCQFSWYCDGKPDVPTDSTTWRKSVSVCSTSTSGRSRRRHST